ncbi:GA module-containing protein, partial [Staphylococcus aureus]
RDTSNVQTTKNNLHGERVLNDDKRTQTYAVNHLDNLNQAQKEALTHEIQQATRVSDVNNVYNKARALDSEMQKLKDIVGQQDSVRKTSNYVNEDSTAQQAYNDAIAQGQAIIDQTTQ